MRPAALLLLLFIVFTRTANAQFTLLPQIGIENPLTKISYNDGSYFKPLQAQLAPHLGLRMDYKFKKGQGVFLGLTTSRSPVSYSFSNVETGMNAYTASVGDQQLRFEGGYQFNTKPIYFNKQAATNKTSLAKTQTVERRGCGGYSASHHCGEQNKIAQKSKINKGWFVRIQPSVGLALVPANQPEVETKVNGSQSTYTYNAGGIKTALITGAGFEFGSGRKRLFTVSLNYFRALNSNATTLTTEAAGKITTTKLNSIVSGWNASIGIPISLSRNKQVIKQKTEVKKFDCQQYFRMRCRKAS